MKIKINDTIIPIPFKIEQILEILNEWGWKWEKETKPEFTENGKITFLIAHPNGKVNGVDTSKWLFAFDNHMMNGDVFRITCMNNETKEKQWIVKHGIFGYKLHWDKVKA